MKNSWKKKNKNWALGSVILIGIIFLLVGLRAINDMAIIAAILILMGILFCVEAYYLKKEKKTAIILASVIGIVAIMQALYGIMTYFSGMNGGIYAISQIVFGILGFVILINLPKRKKL